MLQMKLKHMLLEAHMFLFDKNSKSVAVVLLIVFMLAGCGGAEERKAKHMERGKAYFEEENYEKAKVEFKNVLQIDPKAAEPRYYLGRIAESTQQIRGAFGSYSKAVELDPELIDARIRLGRIFVIAGELDSATEQADEVLTREPGNVDALALRASVFMRQGKVDEQIAILEKINATSPGHVDTVAMLAEAYANQGKADKALQVLEAAEEANPESVSIKGRLVQAYLKRKEFDKAEAILVGLVRTYPDELSYRTSLATFYAQTEQNDKAEAVIRDAIAASPDDIQPYLLLADFFVNKYGDDRAITELETTVKSRPDLTDLQFALASLYLKTEQADKAEALYLDIIDKQGVEPDGLKARTAVATMKFQAGDRPAASSYIAEVLEENPKDNAALILKGRVAIKEENYTEAVTALRSVLKDQPDSVEIYTLLAIAYQASGVTELAEESLRQAVDARQGDVDARMRLAAYLASNGDYDSALEQIDAALVAEPDSVKAVRAKAELLARQGKADELEAVLTHLQEISPETGLGAFGKGRLYKSQKKYAEALASYEEALASEPQSVLVLTEIVEMELRMENPDAAIMRLNQVLAENPDHQAAHFMLGSVYMEKKEFAQAEEEYSKQLIITPENGRVYQLLALSRNSQGDFEGAVNTLEQGLEKLPGDSALLQSLANLYVRKNDLDKAATVYEDALKAAPDDLMLSLGLAGVREQQGRYEDAITLYEQLITSNPDNIYIVNNLAALLADNRSDKQSLSRARELASKLADSDQPALLDTLGWVHYRLEEYDKAAEILSAVVEKAPRVPVFRYHLGMTYYKQGDKRAAKEILSEAVAEDITYEGVEEARRVYKEIGG